MTARLIASQTSAVSLEKGQARPHDLALFLPQVVARQTTCSMRDVAPSVFTQ